MNRHHFAYIVVFVLTVVYLPLTAPVGFAVETLESRPTEAFVFKNGYSLAAIEVDFPTKIGVYQVTPLPDSALGSFWLTWPEGTEIKNVKATVAETETDVDAASIAELLEANIGASVQLADDDTWYKGVIVSVPKRSQDPIIYPQDDKTIPAPNPDERGDVVILKDGSQTYVLSLHAIKKIRFLDAEAGMKLKRLSRQNVIEFEVTKTFSELGKHLYIQYLANGLSWSPSYVVDITNEDKALISAKAVLVNDLIGLDDTRAELVTGYPHLAYADKSSHFTLTPLQQLMQQIQAGRGVQERFAFDNASNNAASFGYAMAKSPSMPSQALEGEAEEDLFFYPIENVTLKKGERGYFPLFAAEAPYQHLYTVSLPDAIQPEVYLRNRGGMPDAPDPVVWHTLKLENESNSPWTTAPAMTMKNGRILGQDTIRYTPRGATIDLKITQAVSVKAEHNEYEIERDPNPFQIGTVSYAKIRVKGEVVVTNFKDEAIELEVEKIVTGEVVEVAGGPEVKKLVKGLQNVNPQSQLTWNRTVEPGVDNALRIEYTYSVYVRM